MLHRETVNQQTMGEVGTVALYSLPAFDTARAPDITDGRSIGSSKVRVPRDSVLLSKLNPRIPRIWRVKHQSYLPAVGSTEFWPLTAKCPNIDLDFLAWYLGSPLFLEHPLIAPASSTNSHQRIDRGAFERFEIALPPLPEQRKIAAILGSVDEAIRATQAVIEQTRTVKQGLLQELLTRGIGHTRFKKTEIGEVPEGWEIATLGDVAHFVTSGSRGWAQYYAATGALFVRITNLSRASIRLDLSDTKHVALPLGDVEGSRTRLLPGDVLISITADLGIVAVIPPEGVGEAYVNQHIALVRPRAEDVEPDFLGHVLASSTGQQQFFRLNDGGAKAGLNLQAIRNVQFALPPLEEQVRISDRLNSVDVILQEQQFCLNQLKILKEGLMQDLLTGRVRVSVG
jgi:type I restriction enzyme, S subunit